MTNRSRLSSSRASAGTRSPAINSTTSPGTNWSIGTERLAPSRRTVAWTATERRSASTAFWARTSWTKSSVMLIVTMLATITKLVTSPVAADRPLATSRMMTSGLRKRARNCRQSGERLTVAASLGPQVANRDCTSALLRPARVVASLARSRSNGSVQISCGPRSRRSRVSVILDRVLACSSERGRCLPCRADARARAPQPHPQR